MAAPPDKTIRNLDGKWVLNKTLSDDFDSILQLQSIGWLTRTAIAYATITLDATHYIDPAPSHAYHLDISSTVTGGIKTTKEARVLDWTFREHKDALFGDLRGRSRFVPVEGVEDSVGKDGWVKEGWLTEGAGKKDPGKKDAEEEGTELLETWVQNEAYGWVAHQVWGFDTRDRGERRYARKVVVRKGENVKRARMVYDYLGEADPVAKEDDGLAYEE